MAKSDGKMYTNPIQFNPHVLNTLGSFVYEQKSQDCILERKKKNTLNLQANCISKSLPENLSNFIRLTCSPCWTSASKSCDNNRTHRLPEMKDTFTLQSFIIIISYRINYVSKLHKCTDKVDSSQIQLNKLNVLIGDFLCNM